MKDFRLSEVPREADVVLARQTHTHAVAYLLRSDGTAFSRLGIPKSIDGIWLVETVYSCVGEGPWGPGR